MRFSTVVALSLLGGCYDPTAPYGAPCSAQRDCPSGQECDVLLLVCTDDPALAGTLRDDSAADFDQPGAVLKDAVIEANGAIGPAAYATGRVRLTGLDGALVAAAGTTTWDSLVATPATGHGFSPSLNFSFGLTAPQGLGLTATDNITVLVEGEIELDVAGAWRFQLTANDTGFVDIAPPGGDFTRLVNDTNTGTVASYNVVTPGWYRIRGAFSDAAQYMTFALAMDSPALSGTFRDITQDQIRTRVDDESGYLFDGFDDTYLLGYSGSTLLDTPLDLSLGMDPFGLTIGTLSYSVRASGQFLIDTDGDYAFTISSHHGHRVWIDGVQVASAFSSTDATTNVPAIHLVPGWHDLVVDVTKTSDPADVRMSMKVASGPVWAGQAIPIDHVRPLPGRVGRWAGAHNGTTLTITDGASVTRTISLFLPSNAVPTSIDANLSFTHTAQAQVGIVLDPPVGANMTFVAPGSLTGTGVHSEHDIVPAADSGTTWNLIASDSTVDAVTGTLDTFNITEIYNGGVAPFPTTYRFESAPRSLELAPLTFGALRWQARQGQPKIQIRSCDDAAGCASQPWVDVAKSGDVPNITVARFIQYAVDFTSDGDTATALDWIELDYVGRGLKI